jgi:alkylation response protein AidB-like acyl-CoA dehydrogenase
LIAFPAFDNPSETQPTLEVVKNEDTYLVSGFVPYVVLGGLAGQALLPARLNGRKGCTFFLIDLADAKLTKSESVFSLGLHACPAIELTLIGAKGTCVGQEGEGERYFTQASSRMHAAAAAMECGIMKGSFQEALAYSQERFQGGREIINWSSLRMMLGEMAVQMKISEMVVSEAALKVEKQDQQWEIYARAAALHLGELACELTTNGIQILGGNGYMKDYGQEKRFRDAKQVQSLLGMVPMRKLSLVGALIK